MSAAPPVMPPADPHNSTVYLDWATLHAPAAEDEARALLALIQENGFEIYEKPGRFLDRVKYRARDLPVEQLPWFWDMTGHRIARRQPRHAAKAYGLARAAEEEHGLPVDEVYHRENTLLFARFGALPATVPAVHQRRLHATLEPRTAHQEFLRLLQAIAAGGAALPKDAHRRIQASGKAAGLSAEDGARALGDLLAAAKGTPLPDGLLEGAARVFATVPPEPTVRQALAELFPTSATDGGAWLRLLAATGIDEAMAEGRIVPAGGAAAWLSDFARHYSFLKTGRAVRRQAMPPELFALVPHMASRIKADDTPLCLHQTRFRRPRFDADLVDLCLASGLAVVDPGPRVELEFWGKESRRDMRALAADPVLGVRLAGTRYAPKPPPTGARLPLREGVDPELHARVTRLLDALAEGGLGAAQEAVAELDTVLSPPAITALDGIDAALKDLDGIGPLLRTLRSGLPEELGWPALDDALAELNGAAGEGTWRSAAGRSEEPGTSGVARAEVGTAVAGVTCTWPVLTVFTRERAIAVDFAGRRGECTFSLPEDGAVHSVFYVGGSFLVGCSPDGHSTYARKAFWADRPEEVFVPAAALGMVPFGGSTDGALGYQFATADGTGRYDGERVLRPGGHEGIGYFEQQLNDGTQLWSSRLFGGERDNGAWREIDPVTGARTDRAGLPPFLAAEPPQGLVRTHDLQTLAPLPPGAPASPLGQADGVSGCRVLHWKRSAPRRYLLEGIDGRRAEFQVTRQGEDPWGIIRLPEGGAEAVVTEHDAMRCYSADDNSLLWQVRRFPQPKRRGRWAGSGQDAPMFPPPAFWHFLTPRDTASSGALRTVGEDAARALLETARTGDEDAVRAASARVLPGVTHPRILDGVVRAARAAATVAERREVISGRVALIGAGAQVRPAGEVTDVALFAALRELVRPYVMSSRPGTRPATVTALAADGEFLRGRIDDGARRVSPPARPRDWAVLLGHIDAAAWRFAVETTAAEDVTALDALLRTWAATPFAEPGAWRLGRATGEALRPHCADGRAVATGMGDGRQQIAPDPKAPLDPAAEYRFVQPASAPVPEAATEVRTVTVTREDAARLRALLDLRAAHGPVRITPEAVAAFVAGTGVRRAVAVWALAGLPTKNDGRTGTQRMLRAKPYQATVQVVREAEHLVARLGTDGRRHVLAAGPPDDPAELWTPGGPVAAAERMAAVWTALLGQQRQVDEELSAEVERELGLDDSFSSELSAPDGGSLLTEDLRHLIATDEYGYPHVYPAAADGSPGKWPSRTMPYAGIASLLVWALTERPVGDPATVGVPALCARLRERLDAPELLVDLHSHALDTDVAGVFGPALHPVAATGPLPDSRRPPVLYDQGLLIVQAETSLSQVFLRPAGFSERGRYEYATRICADLGHGALVAAIDRIRMLRDGVEALAERAAHTPVPAGDYEANPLLSVPELVDEAAAALAVGRDAAALYLQLLTLARPTDRNIRRWNGWTQTRHRTAQAELVACQAVLADKRSRAGRSVFIPGGWTDLKAPHLPLETAKLAAYGAISTERGEIQGPFTRLLPPRPLHILFAEAWQSTR
ncbi:hypothetical protein ACFVJW_21450 [Streptomyces libani]|uniref:hypothetical protein n=1 Tax=Streptomyces nigrescens TaxID=1920 RepID=UPI00362A678C